MTDLILEFFKYVGIVILFLGGAIITTGAFIAWMGCAFGGALMTFDDNIKWWQRVFYALLSLTAWFIFFLIVKWTEILI